MPLSHAQFCYSRPKKKKRKKDFNLIKTSRRLSIGF